MRYEVHAFGVHYASFAHEDDAQRWALAMSKDFTRTWWHINIVDKRGDILIAFQNGNIVYGRDNNVLTELMG